MKNKEKRALVIDLDGTLLDSKKEISVINLSRLKGCMDLGHVVIIATARPLRTVRNKFPESLSPPYFVLCNGAWVTKGSEVIHRNEIQYDDVMGMCSKLVQCGYKPMIEAMDSFFADGERESWFEGDVYPITQYPEIDACKILAYNRNGIDSNHIDSIISDDFTKVIIDNGTLLQVSVKGCTKVSACEKILNIEQVSWDTTFAFGDDRNDLPVFQRAAFPIAMKNASEEVKLHAKWITESNDDDGVAVAIDNLILNRTQVLPINS